LEEAHYLIVGLFVSSVKSKTNFQDSNL